MLAAAHTIQYVSAMLCAEQVGKNVPREPFSALQQKRSRLDGGKEIDGTDRKKLDVNEPEPQGHIVREELNASAEGRATHKTYSQVPLTGCHQSMLHTYRLPQSFGAGLDDEEGIYRLDEKGLSSGTGAKVNQAWFPWSTDEKGQATHFLLADGTQASNEDIKRCQKLFVESCSGEPSPAYPEPQP